MHAELCKSIVAGRMLAIVGGKALRRIGRKENDTLPRFWGEAWLESQLSLISEKVRLLTCVFDVFS